LLDFPVALIDGGSVNLAHFCGQKLVVHFCAPGAAGEIAAFESLAEAFEEAGAWRVAASTADVAAFEALAGRFVHPAPPRPEAGGTFVIDRDGVPRHFWPGPGHARAALDIARERP
jgi:hypothetical protein